MTEYRSRPLAEPCAPAITTLIAMAHAGRLIACAGAGLSVAAGAGLPNGRELSTRLDTKAAREWTSYTSPADPRDLIQTADAALAAAGSLVPLQHLVLGLADFLQARPNPGHRAMALLLAEGAIRTVLLWNWDTCIERAAPPDERISVLRGLGDLTDVTRPNVAKVHGCATRASTLLITSDQLKAPPVWTEAALEMPLANATVVFVGVGDVADYADRRLRDFASSAAGLDVYLVSPSIVSGWSDSTWATIFPTLDEAHRLGLSADEFLDQLLRAWSRWLLDNFDRLTTSRTMSGIGVVRTELAASDALTLATWCREVAMRKEMGASLITSDSTTGALIALAVLATDLGSGAVRILRGAQCEIGGQTVNVITLPRPETASDVQVEARRRAEQLVLRGASSPVAFLVSGMTIGSIGITDSLDLIAPSVPDDLIHGPSSAEIEYLVGQDLLARVA